jgi:thiamine-phosphate pyrophosphorylase
VSGSRSLGDDRRERLRRARLYLVVEASAESVLDPALRGGVDMVQLRDKHATDDAILAAAARFRRVCDEHGALLWLNDRPDLALEARVDGVHVGQDDEPVAAVRELVGPDVLIGLSTHSPAQLSAALSSPLADELSVGPVYETPTKQGRSAAGLDYVRHAARQAGDRPWFAIGGVDRDTVHEVTAAGASRICVVRAIRDVPDPRAAAAELRAALGDDGVAAV